MNKIVVIAPHPDDETLGCGGTLLKHKKQGDQINWIIFTEISEELGLTKKEIKLRAEQIEKIRDFYGFDSVHQLKFPSAQLDVIPMVNMIKALGEIFHKVHPEIIYLPHQEDAHSDHRYVFDAAASCTKWFRYPSIKKILAYETLSETDFRLGDSNGGFQPNLFIDVSEFLDSKIKAMNIYASEIKEFPFPRSEKAIRALASLRGAAAGCESAEAFMVLKEIW